jgi:hypothetical protein
MQKSLQVRFKDVDSCDQAAAVLREWGGFDSGRMSCSATARLRMGRTMTRPRLRQPSPLSRQVTIPTVSPNSPGAHNLSRGHASRQQNSQHNPAAIGVGSPVLKSISWSQERVTGLPLSGGQTSTNHSVSTNKSRAIPEEYAQQASTVGNAGAETSQHHSGVDMAQYNQDVEITWTTCLQDWHAQIETCFQATKGIEDENKRSEITTSYGHEIEARHKRLWGDVFAWYANSW